MTKIIVLDAGHALNTAGNKTLDGIYEWAMNNKVALEVKRLLEEYDVVVHRVDDTSGKTDVSLYDRVVKTNQLKPDAFVSIHHNAYNSKWGNHTGVEAYYNLNRKNDLEKKMATDVAADMSKNTGLLNRGAKTAAFYVLTGNTTFPAVLTEGGFMDSLIDHPIITSTKGQNAYAQAVVQMLIKHISLTKKVKTPPESTLKIGDTYVLTSSKTGFFTAADAAVFNDGRVKVVAGEYYIYNLANSMINITKTRGYPGSWINPDEAFRVDTPVIIAPTQTYKIGDKYQLKNSTPGYYTASDAINGKDQRVTVLTGEYTIFNIAQEMLNITKTPGKAGSWINPKTQLISEVSIGDKYTLKTATGGYYTSDDALAKKNQKVSLLPGEYYVFNIAKGMINLTKTKGQPGSWINP